MAILEVKDLKAYYITHRYGRTTSVKAVDGVSFKVEKDEIYGIAGESGCGKSTLLKAISGLVKPPLQILEGGVTYNFDGERLNILALNDEKQRRKLRGARLSLVPQGSMSVLNPVRRVRKSFEDVLYAHFDLSEQEFEDVVRKHLDALGLDWTVMHTYPHQLSGGMRQRITIALSTILKPDIIFADEPTTALDVVVQRGVVQLIKKIKEEQQNTLVLVTHDLSIHANLCDRLAVMYAGKIVEEGEVDRIFSTPKHPYTIMLLNSLPKLGDSSPRSSAPGAPPSLVNPPSGCRFHPRCPHVMERCRTESPDLIEMGNGHRVACFLEEGSK
ncbi:MAG: ABC transporter ATP-binding protein [Limnochordia bacterium]|jgi:peptide/nickel transport system ATP-binding protein|nr:ABC transporter ATP-binding protein [Bacillota bacterium]HBG10048.1 ABC transporter ATP-binding protein [Bacillota bacterium]